MNILSINSIPAARPAFGAEQKAAIQPFEEQVKVHDKFFNIADDTIEQLKEKIRYTEGRLEAEKKYALEEVKSYKERQYVEKTIMGLEHRLNAFNKELAKRLTKI